MERHPPATEGYLDSAGDLGLSREAELRGGVAWKKLAEPLGVFRANLLPGPRFLSG